jgi:hypothetical protein
VELSLVAILEIEMLDEEYLDLDHKDLLDVS